MLFDRFQYILSLFRTLFFLENQGIIFLNQQYLRNGIFILYTTKIEMALKVMERK